MLITLTFLLLLVALSFSPLARKHLAEIRLVLAVAGLGRVELVVRTKEKGPEMECGTIPE